MDYVFDRFEKMAPQLIKALERRNHAAYYAASKEEARDIALSLIPKGSSVGWGGSMSMMASGIIPELEKGDYTLLDRAKTDDVGHLQREIFFADFFLGSTNALSEDGILVNIDGNGNRIGAMAFGPKNVILFVGRNKVVKTADDAYRRAKYTAAPINAGRFDIKTPCQVTGECADCISPDNICCEVLTIRFSRVKGRIKIILVNEDLGF
ncbi:MAG: lactate utilization protein [Lachnospiraceae bacterium]|nr:lactate utilization protein [Lachnospiraceae bacterium]